MRTVAIHAVMAGGQRFSLPRCPRWLMAPCDERHLLEGCRAPWSRGRAATARLLVKKASDGTVSWTVAPGGPAREEEDQTMRPQEFQPLDSAVIPRFAEPATFMRTPYVSSYAGLDIALVGVPFDLGSTNRAGARHGPAQIREMSRLIRG